MQILDQLLSMHADIRAILNILEPEVKALGQEGKADLGAMQDGLYYITQYLRPSHTEQERVIYRSVAAREHSVARLVDELTQQHEELRQRSEELLESVDDMIEDVLVAKAEFDARAHHYIELQRLHVAQEENELLPLADQLLTDDDWQQIEQTLQQQQWPSFAGIAPGEKLHTFTGGMGRHATS